MMTHNENQKGFLQFCILAAWICVIIYIQSYILQTLPSFLKDIDFVTITMVFLFFKQTTLMSTGLALFSGSLVDSLSTVRPGFFILFYLISLILIKIFEKFFYRESFLSKVMLFSIILLLKLIWMYALIDNNKVSILSFLSFHYIQFFLSLLTFLLLITFAKITTPIFYRPHFSKKIY